jgi:hypothetical protein
MQRVSDLQKIAYFAEAKSSNKEGLNTKPWSTLPFGKYAGHTLPEIILGDPDWFFWVLPKLYGTLAKEAQHLARKARGMKIPKRYGKKLEGRISIRLRSKILRFCFRQSRSCHFEMRNKTYAP